MTGLRDLLQGVYEARGELTPEILIEEARPAKSPLHNRFEWDDTKAAEAYRRDQAHELIRSVKIRYSDSKDQPRDVRAFVAVPRPGSHAPNYEPLADVLADDFKRQLLLQEFERDWKTFKARYEALVEFTQVISADLARAAA